MIVSMLAATALLADVVAAPTPPPSPTAPARPANSVAATKNPLICKNQALLGSRMAKKICMSKSQWEERRQQDRQDLERQQHDDPQAHI